VSITGFGRGREGRWSTSGQPAPAYTRAVRRRSL